MLFQCRSLFSNSHIDNLFVPRKVVLSPLKKQISKIIPPKHMDDSRRRAFFFAPLKAGMTVEASLALPIFFLCMVTVLHLGSVMETAARFGSALCETGEEMAIAAYALEYGEKNSLISGGLSAVYASSRVLGKTGSRAAVKNTNFLLSSFLKENEMIHLVMTYQIKTPVGGIKIPSVFFLQRASLRGWTGRKGSDGIASEGNEGEGLENSTVYVTEHGTVYHKDLQCTHIKLSIQQVGKGELEGLRNSSGGKYHSCEKCGSNAGGAVYITGDGDRYHSTLECSGLKRTVKEVSLEELGDMRSCSKCGTA